MAYPYLPSGGILRQAVDQFRRSIPSTIDAATLKKLGIAPSNEGYVINTLKFLGFVNEENSRTDIGHEAFTTHDDGEFQSKIAIRVRESYSDLFDLRGEDAWKLNRDALISFFRTSDKTSEIVGKRQAVAFTTLAAISGMREDEASAKAPRPRKAGETPIAKSAKPKRTEKASSAKPENLNNPPLDSGIDPNRGNVGLTVRIEINLPANGSQETYDSIFQSIRKNLFP